MSQEKNQDFARLRQQVHRMGFNRKTTTIIIGECALFVFANIVGLALVINISDLLWKAVGMALISFGCMGLSTNGHTASHHAISNKSWLDEFITYFDFAFFLGVSGKYWKHKHIVVHHPHPNIIGVDDDADLMPIFTLNKNDVAQAKGFRRWWYRHQGYFFPVVLLGNSFGVAFKGWRFLLKDLFDEQRRDKESWIDLACLLSHWALWTIIPIFIFGFANVATFFVIQMFIMSYVMFALFAPAHYPDDAIQITSDATRDNYLMLQTATAVNFETGPIGRLLCGGVDYQLEHHLFPWISPRHYPALSPILKTFCEENGYPYRSQGWGIAIWKSYLTLFHPKDIFDRFPEYDTVVADAHPQALNSRREIGTTNADVTASPVLSEA